MAKTKFKQGEFVRLAADAGPQMIVLEYAQERLGWVRCFWFSLQNDYCLAEFPEAMLKSDDLQEPEE